MDFSYLLTDYITLILLILMAIAFIMLSVHYGLFFLRVGRFQRVKKHKKGDVNTENTPVDDENLPPVSIVLVAQNEAEWLRNNLVYLLEQDYPSYEVVVVDYKSTDDTRFILQVCSENYKHLRWLTMNQDVNMFQGKKYPLSIGIKSAKNDIILLTDPDSKPATFNWIRNMMKGYKNNQTQIVLGYCGIVQETSLLNWLQQYDNLHYTAYYLGNALLKHPVTGTGRNLSYRRSFFFQRNAFIRHYTHEYGADDLFVNQNATKINTQIAIGEEAFVMTDAKKSFSQWRIERKCRSITKPLHPFSEKLVSWIYPLSILIFYGTWTYLIATQRFPWQILVAVLGVKIIWQILAENQLAKRFGVKAVQWFSPFFEIYFLFANTISRILPLPKNRL